ncbi:hypothetical protein HYH02_011199 [Chlamydomonas schloesseri]|uniref:Uncharacterized protein n=1 Tax=Chlamydomonas schloesseri TaxID=2026947 RepID=A0A835T240_9CHLO|nr:hypothetical protein HYH02_011199 [Chlamydomonas schloesseri]|eukprot:KAG2437557.1 hypothetical protein HYH02_011199 [Chlamydomonas schloesseri]
MAAPGVRGMPLRAGRCAAARISVAPRCAAHTGGRAAARPVWRRGEPAGDDASGAPPSPLPLPPPDMVVGTAARKEQLSAAVAAGLSAALAVMTSSGCSSGSSSGDAGTATAAFFQTSEGARSGLAVAAAAVTAALVTLEDKERNEGQAPGAGGSSGGISGSSTGASDSGSGSGGGGGGPRARSRRTSSSPDSGGGGGGREDGGKRAEAERVWRQVWEQVTKVARFAAMGLAVMAAYTALFCLSVFTSRVALAFDGWLELRLRSGK